MHKITWPYEAMFSRTPETFHPNSHYTRSSGCGAERQKDILLIFYLFGFKITSKCDLNVRIPVRD